MVVKQEKEQENNGCNDNKDINNDFHSLKDNRINSFPGVARVFLFSKLVLYLNMSRYLLLIAALACTSNVFSQSSVKEYVVKNFSPVSSISDTNYSGFEAIDKAIGNKRVVMLGEQDHGDATAFIAKTKIIKYLHEKKGFNVLAFESDFFSLTEGQKEITDATQMRLYMQTNIFPIWTYCDGCRELFYEYLPATLSTANPVVVTGFDSQLHGSYANRNYHSYLYSALSTLNGIGRLKEKIVNHSDSLRKYYGRPLPDIKQYDSANSWLQQAIELWQQQKGKDYTWRLLNSLKGFNQQAADQKKEYNEQNKARDEQMAANLDWLVNEKYKNEKIIVWAASAHIIKNVNDIMKEHFKSMGTLFCAIPGNEAQTYVMGFTSATGTTGRLAGGFKPYDLRKPDKDAFEKWLGNADYGFVDLSAYQNSTTKPEAFKLKGINHFWNGKLQWSRSYDGIFYIKEMHPCNPVAE